MLEAKDELLPSWTLIIYKQLDLFSLPLHLDKAFAFKLGLKAKQISSAQLQLKIFN